MTIIEFLEARIAEDEAQAHNVLVFRMNPRTNMPGNQAIPARVRAECAAKRAILDLCDGDDMHGPRENCDDCTTIYILASVYADHPDYQQEWAC